MKLFILVCLLGVVVRGEISENFKSSVELPDVYGYHVKHGIPMAAKVKAAEEARDFDGSRIVGGSISLQGEAPYMGGLAIILTIGLTSICGSTMISNSMVVTAASCWNDGVIRGHTVTVVLGSPTLYFGGTRYATRTVIEHPNWNPTNIDSLRFNLALIPIRHTAYTSIIQSATLPSGSLLSNNFINSIARASGFGLLRDENNIGAYQFQYHVNLRVIANSDCSRFYTGITDGLLCTSGEGTVGLCRGDTGGPLTTSSGGSNVLIGISSFYSQYGCEAQRPSGFTRVTSTVDWIRTEMNRRRAL